jgi:hypothetical protein
MSQGASEIYRAFLERQLRGDEADLEALCAGHPDIASELKSLAEENSRLLELLTPIGGAKSPSPPPVRDRADNNVSAGEHRLTSKDGSEQSGGNLRYQVQEQIARGGMGRIVLAWDNELRRKVAM